MSWKVIRASSRGTAHQVNDLPCQDANHFHTVGPWLFAAVSDGAGSYRYSQQGAAHGVQVTTVLRDKFAEDPALRDMIPGAWGPSIAAAIHDTRIALMRQMKDVSESLRDYHATLVGCVAGPKGGLFFHIGDGAGIALDQDTLAAVAVSKPENGEFAEETYFYTEDHWREHLRLTPIPQGTGLIALLSDGAVAFALTPTSDEVDLGFFEPVTRYLSREDVTTEIGNIALETTLASPGACEVTQDDKTLLWARWYP